MECLAPSVSLDDNRKILVVIMCVFRLCQMSPERQSPSGLRIIDLESSDKVCDGKHSYKTFILILMEELLLGLYQYILDKFCLITKNKIKFPALELFLWLILSKHENSFKFNVVL